jgi:hypothetical protein
VTLYASAAPSDIVLRGSQIAENRPAGSVVGTFANPNGNFTYTLVSGPGSDDNAAFSVGADDSLQTAMEFDFETKASYSIRVRRTDESGQWTEKAFTITVVNENETPTIVVPGPQTVFEDVDKSITGIRVGEPDGTSLTVTLQVDRGVLHVEPNADVTIEGNGTGLLSISGSVAGLNASLASLIYRPDTNYSGPDALSITATDGSLSVTASVNLTIKSALQQAADLQAQVNALQAAGILNKGQAISLRMKLNLKGDPDDVAKVQSFLDQVQALLASGVLTKSQADALLVAGNVLLLSVQR